jgi:hypothetical protein
MAKSYCSKKRLQHHPQITPNVAFWAHLALESIIRQNGC